jgi:hypothetical protein
MKISRTDLNRVSRLEAAAPTGYGNWVVGWNGELIWEIRMPSRKNRAVRLAIPSFASSN